MGCSEITFEQEVRDDIMKYIESLKITPTERKNKIIKMIDDDLKKKGAAFNSYHYQYRDDDKTKVVEEYKTMISNELGQPRTQPQQDKKKMLIKMKIKSIIIMLIIKITQTMQIPIIQIPIILIMKRTNKILNFI